jgi:hypothetical protein
MRSRAVTDARVLPPAARQAFVSGFTTTTQKGLQVGRGQQAAAIPRGTPASLAAELRRLAADVFGHGYIAAMRPTIAVSVGLLAVGAALCLLLPRHTAAATAASQPAPDNQLAVKGQAS